jgi:hypothetical protein
VLDQLGRLVHLEVDAKHCVAQCQPAQVIVAGDDLAGVRIDRLERAGVGRDAMRYLICRGMPPVGPLSDSTG